MRFEENYSNFPALEIENLSLREDGMSDFVGRHQDNSYLFGTKLLETVFNEINPNNFISQEKILNISNVHV